MSSDDDEDFVIEEVKPKPKAKAQAKTAIKGKAPAAAKKKPATPKKVTAAKKPATTPKKKKRAVSSDEDSDEDASSFNGDDSDEEMPDSAKQTSASSKPSPAKQSIEQIYQKKTQLEHILLRPDTYVGSIEPVTQSMWVFNDETKKMESRKITYVPGLYKIFDEIIVNACDNKQRDKTMDTIKVTIDAEKGMIAVWNNGKGIPVVMHKEHNVYVPELIFGHLLTGSNFDDKKKKTTGGRNGYGAKLANIFSNEFIVETADSSTKQRYKQVFSDNMSKKGTPTITSWSRKDYTCISFKPDLERFKMTSLDEDIVALFKKRVYDIAGVTDKSLNVFLNEEKIAVKTFPGYVELYRNTSPSSEEGASAGDTVIFDKPDERWQVGVGVSDDGFQQISFVNGICTTKGGQHVNYITDQIATKLIAVVKKKNKGEAVKPNYIKNHMTVYVSALIDNPAFDSQTKETLTTRAPSFGSTYTLSDKFLKQIEKSGMVERILSFAAFKQTAELRRKGGATAKKSRLTGITKLDDANNAGTAKGHNCTLIVTEGDSAKTIAVGGLSVVGRDYYGVFPLRGKLLNVREAAHSQILKNEEIQNVVKILGLKYGQKYESTKGLRYGHLMIMADQDHDGSHIKGLVINFIHHFWPSLLKIEGFLQEFITPIVKCTKGRLSKVFYTIPEYEAWREITNNGRGWNIKYYKGLGTSTTQEAKGYFSDLKTHQIGFVYDGAEDGDLIDMAFSKKRVEERKDWLRGYEAGTHVDYDVDEMAYSDFVNKELILFSMADNLRSIPSVVDGFKPSQRKVLFCCFKRNLRAEIKVAQLSGYVSEHSAYHHGEQSLHGTIINMAQDYMGSNNVHLLSPNGQFGTRLQGGKDAASPRYIFTNLEVVSRIIFDPLDNDILNHLDEDGQSIEPEWYVPIIPMALVNGSEGIGTGWSSSIPNYNPHDITQNLRRKINGDEMEPLVPWYRGFIGKIFAKESGRGSDSQTFIVQGLYEIPDDSTLVITELPVKSWTQNYKVFLESLLESGTIKDFKENHTDTAVLFTISLEPKTLQEFVQAPGGIMKKFKLETTISTSNMHLFDAKGRIRKYETPLEVLEEFYSIRLDFYDRRKTSMLAKLQDQIKTLSNKTRFILSVIDGTLVVSNRKKQDILDQLVQDGYDIILASSKKSKKQSNDDDNSGDELDETADVNLSAGYDYLLSMKIMSLTKERVEKLRAELQDREQEFRDLEAKSVQELWLADLDNLDKVLDETEQQRQLVATSVPKMKRTVKSKKSAKPRKMKHLSDEEDDDSDYDAEPKSKAKQHAKSKQAVKKEPKKEPKKEVKKETTESKKEESASLITSFFGVKETKNKEPKPKPPAKEKKDDVEVLSLAERLARRVQVTPQKPKTSTVNLASSDEDESEKSSASDDEDDVFSVAASKTKRKVPAVTKADKPKAVKKPLAGNGKAKISSTIMDSPPRKPKASLKRPKEKTPKKAARSIDETMDSESPVRAPPATKKQKRSDSEDSNGDDSPDLAPRRATRTRARITYEEISSDEEDDEAQEEEEEEEMSKPARSSKKKADSGESSEFSEAEEDDDDESDFEED